MGNCMSKSGQTADPAPVVQGEKSKVQDEAPKLRLLSDSVSSKETNEEKPVTLTSDKAASTDSEEVETKDIEKQSLNDAPKTEAAVDDTTESGLKRFDSGKGLAEDAQEEKSSLDNVIAEEKKNSTEVAAPDSKVESTESPVPDESAVAVPVSTDNIQTETSVPAEWPLKTPTEEKPEPKLEETKETDTTPQLTHLITTFPPSDAVQPSSSTVPDPSTASPSSGAGTKTELTEQETQQTTPPASDIVAESPILHDAPVLIPVGSNTSKSKFHEAADLHDKTELKDEKAESVSSPVSRIHTAPQEPTPVSPATTAAKRQSRISRMFSVGSKKNSDSKRVSILPAIPKADSTKQTTMAAIKEKTRPTSLAPFTPLKEEERPVSNNGLAGDLPSPVVEGRKWKEEDDNSSLFCY